MSANELKNLTYKVCLIIEREHPDMDKKEIGRVAKKVILAMASETRDAVTGKEWE